jgi:hypothetical protein
MLSGMEASGAFSGNLHSQKLPWLEGRKEAGFLPGCLIWQIRRIRQCRKIDQFHSLVLIDAEMNLKGSFLKLNIHLFLQKCDNSPG